ncbi:hypothetical protein [Lactobacillus crispatus]|nr:hypothetical protein [Lactobacillus crispatus]MCZ3592564.1 hypothetical protein [Lactobacillus crispatus]MCZ3601216.1 hypothetical protein [Lactobacillus crispatus]
MADVMLNHDKLIASSGWRSTNIGVTGTKNFSGFNLVFDEVESREVA